MTGGPSFARFVVTVVVVVWSKPTRRLGQPLDPVTDLKPLCWLWLRQRLVASIKEDAHSCRPGQAGVAEVKPLRGLAIRLPEPRLRSQREGLSCSASAGQIGAVVEGTARPWALGAGRLAHEADERALTIRYAWAVVWSKLTRELGSHIALSRQAKTPRGLGVVQRPVAVVEGTARPCVWRVLLSQSRSLCDDLPLVTWWSQNRSLYDDLVLVVWWLRN